MKLWELLHSVPLTGETPDLDMEINSISYDTRTLEPGALFAALPGARDDGARYIREALDRGAAAVLCRERPEEDGPWLVTPDPRRALALLSANWFGRPAGGLTLGGDRDQRQDHHRLSHQGYAGDRAADQGGADRHRPEHGGG